MAVAAGYSILLVIVYCCFHMYGSYRVRAPGE